MNEHPSLTSIEPTKEHLEEQLKRKILQLQTENAQTTDRLEKIGKLKEEFIQLQEQQVSLRSKEDEELDKLLKTALELFIKRLQG